MTALHHVTHSCATPGCFAIITMHPAEEVRLRRSHETFYCPAGHSNYFAGKTEHEKRIAQLERQLERHRREDLESSVKQRRIAERLLNAYKHCPFDCGWSSRRRPDWNRTESGYAALAQRIRQDLVDHLVEAHGAEVPEFLEVVA